MQPTTSQTEKPEAPRLSVMQRILQRLETSNASTSRKERPGDGSMAEKARIDDILRQMDPSARLDPEVRNILAAFADDYVQEMIVKGCDVAKHRGSKKMEAKDVEFAIKQWF
jgi:transcription initiation factor TFIID subunit TAF12